MCLQFYEFENDTEEWTPICARMLEHIDGYDKLIESIGDVDSLNITDIVKLTNVLIENNYFNISNMEEVRNFEDIKNERCKGAFDYGDIERKINAIFLSKFGQDCSESLNLIEKYGTDIDSIENEDLKCYIKSMKVILEIKDEEILEEIFDNIEPVKDINPILMERRLKNEYGKLYNKDLFSMEDAVPVEKLGENIYEIPIDEIDNIKKFNMIITSVAPFCYNNPENFYKDWNRPSIGSQHFCASYIRRNMLGTASIPHLCY